MNEILTIAIPTFNRSSCLEKCIDSIVQQIDSETPISIKIFDNNSTDDTKTVVESFQSKTNKLQYYRNSENIGPDLNIRQAYYTSDSKYTLVFGDDDVFLAESISTLIKILSQKQEFGLIFLNYYHFSKSYIEERPKINRTNRIYSFSKGSKLIEMARMRIGFISACIVNNLAINKREILEFVGTQFNHLSPILRASQLEINCLYVGDYLIAQQITNFNIKDYFKTFADNYYNVTRTILGEDSSDFKLLKSELLLKTLPYAIYKAKSGDKDYSFSPQTPSMLKLNYGHDYRYYLIIFPVMNFSILFSKIIQISSRMFFKVFYNFKLTKILFRRSSLSI